MRIDSANLCGASVRTCDEVAMLMSSRVRLRALAMPVRSLIMSKRLKAVKVGSAWLIDPKDLDAVKDRKVGRPRKARKNTKK